MDETMVNNNIQEQITEETVEPAESISTVMNPVQPEAKTEPGYVKTRIEQALARERDNIRAELRAEFQPIQDQLLEMQAEKLVSNGDFKDVKLAKEYLQLKQGIAPTEQPRNEKGQFAKSDPVLEARNQILRDQAARIKKTRGIDVVAEITDEDTRNRILGGEIDFYGYLEERGNRKSPPAPARSSNGANGRFPSVFDMNDKEFAEMEKRLKEGARFGID